MSETRSDSAGGAHRSLLLSLVATLSVAVVPTFFAFAVLVFGRPDPQVLSAVLLAILLTAGAVVAGSAIWADQPEAAGVSFGDLMLWSWIRHYQAERTLYNATETLGFERYGRFLGHSTASEHEQVSAMRAIAKALDAKSTYTLGHSSRVAKHAGRVADELSLPDEQARALVLAAELHDVGNIALSDEVLHKAGQLTMDERADIEAHVLLGARMVEKAGSTEVVEGIRHHHERWDGEGYPEHLRGDLIPVFARVIAIAEAYDAMTSTRPYRQSLSKQGAMEVLRAEAAAQFDGELVEVFISTLRRPIALAERLPWLAAIQGQLRELVLVFKRIGAVAVSATASTIAIALILGSTVLAPGTPEASVPELAEGTRKAEPIDRVLGERLTSPDEDVAALSEAVVDPQSDDSSDAVRGVGFRDDAVRVASLQGPEVVFGDGDNDLPHGGDETPPPGDGGDTPPPDDGGNSHPPSGGESPPPGDGGETPPPDDEGDTPPDEGEDPPPPEDDKDEGGEDKNSDRPGNGHGNGNNPGHGEGGPGNSENAPRDDEEGGPGNSENAPRDDEEGGDQPGSQREDVGKPENAGKSDEAPGQDKAR